MVDVRGEAKGMVVVGITKGSFMSHGGSSTLLLNHERGKPSLEHAESPWRSLVTADGRKKSL